MKSNAFTMIELIIVIVVAGILAAVMIPRMERDNLRMAANQVVRHIQYTQHLAMVDDVYNAAEPQWYKALWRISFRTNNCYIVTSNIDLNTNYDRNESAEDPLTRSLLYSNTSCTQNSLDNSDMFLNSRYGIDNIVLSSSCGSNQFIAFDHMGRPHKSLGSALDLITTVCQITLHAGSRQSSIAIYPETGYTKITAIN